MTNDSAALLLICELYAERMALREQVTALRRELEEMRADVDQAKPASG